jgi:tungstate transport system substrate-binding protein
MIQRRSLLAATVCAWIGPPAPGHSAPRGAATAVLRVGFERLLAECGLAAALRRGFSADTGLAFDIVPGPSSALLDALERGELDAAATHAPTLEARLEAAGLAHDRRPLASTDFLIAGPQQKGHDPAAIKGLRDAAVALGRIAQAQVPFLTRADGSGTHLAEQALWRAAGIAPQTPWYRGASAEGLGLLQQARDAGACTLVDRASWLAAPVAAKAGLGVLVEGDPRLATSVSVQRSFRTSHPAGKLFGRWLAGQAARRIVARSAGLRPPPR